MSFPLYPDFHKAPLLRPRTKVWVNQGPSPHMNHDMVSGLGLLHREFPTSTSIALRAPYHPPHKTPLKHHLWSIVCASREDRFQYQVLNCQRPGAMELGIFDPTASQGSYRRQQKGYQVGNKQYLYPKTAFYTSHSPSSHFGDQKIF